MLSGARVAMVLPLADARAAHLCIECMRRHPGVSVFVPSQPEAASWPADARPTPLPFLGTRHNSQWLSGLEAIIAGDRFVLVHLLGEPWSLSALRLVRGQTPVVVHGVENLCAEAPLAYRARRFGVRYVLGRVAGYVNWGESGLRAFAACGLPAATPRAVISGAPPDPARFPPAPARAVDDGVLRLLFVGRLVAEKGAEDVVRMTCEPPLRGRVRARILGEGPEQRALRALATRIGAPVEIAGAATEDDVRRAMVWSDVVVVPSRPTARWTEQWGRVVVEAMLTQRAVIATDSGELPFLVGDPGLLAPPSSPAALARIAARLLDAPALLRAKQEDAAVRGQRHTPAALATRTLAFWAEVLDARRRR